MSRFHIINEDFFDDEEIQNSLASQDVDDMEDSQSRNIDDYEFCLQIIYRPSFSDFKYGAPYPYNIKKLEKRLSFVFDNIRLFDGYYIGKINMSDYNRKDINEDFFPPYPISIDLEPYGHSIHFTISVYFNNIRHMPFEKFCRVIYKLRLGCGDKLCEGPNGAVSYKFVNVKEDKDINSEVTGWFAEGDLEMYYDYFIKHDKNAKRRYTTDDSYFAAVNSGVDMAAIAKAGVVKAKKKYGYDLVLCNVWQYKGKQPPRNIDLDSFPYISVELYPKSAEDKSITVSDIERMITDCFLNAIPFDYFFHMKPMILVKPMKLKVVDDNPASSRYDNKHKFFENTSREVTYGPAGGLNNKKFWRLRSGEWERRGSSDYFYIVIVDSKGKIVRDHSEFNATTYEAAGLWKFVRDKMTDPSIWEHKF